MTFHHSQHLPSFCAVKSWEKTRFIQWFYHVLSDFACQFNGCSKNRGDGISRWGLVFSHFMEHLYYSQTWCIFCLLSRVAPSRRKIRRRRESDVMMSRQQSRSVANWDEAQWIWQNETNIWWVSALSARSYWFLLKLSLWFCRICAKARGQHGDRWVSSMLQNHSSIRTVWPQNVDRLFGSNRSQHPASLHHFFCFAQATRLRRAPQFWPDSQDFRGDSASEVEKQIILIQQISRHHQPMIFLRESSEVLPISSHFLELRWQWVAEDIRKLQGHGRTAKLYSTWPNFGAEKCRSFEDVLKQPLLVEMSPDTTTATATLRKLLVKKSIAWEKSALATWRRRSPDPSMHRRSRDTPELLVQLRYSFLMLSMFFLWFFTPCFSQPSAPLFTLKLWRHRKSTTEFHDDISSNPYCS